MGVHQKNCVRLPSTLALLVKARASQEGVEDKEVLHGALSAFLRLSPSLRDHLIFNFHWHENACQGGAAYWPWSETLTLARHAKVNCWSRDQTIAAAVGWFLGAF